MPESNSKQISAAKIAESPLNLGTIACMVLTLSGVVGVWFAVKGGGNLGQCAESGACNEIAGSEWSRLFGVIPVAFLGAAVYLGLAVVGLCFKASKARNNLIVAFGLSVVVAAIWFTAVQLMIFGKLCVICTTMHGLASFGVVLLVIAIKKLPATPVVWNRPALLVPVACAALMVAGSPVSGLWASGPKFVGTSDHASHLVEVAEDQSALKLLGEFTVAKRSLPQIGQGSAKQAMVIVTNFGCSHCLRLMKQLREVGREIPSDSVSIHLLPAALSESSADALAVLLSIWRASPSAFDRISNSVIEGELKWSAAALRESASRQFSAREVDGWLSTEAMEKSKREVALFGQIVKRASESRGLKGFPQIWLKDGVVEGAAEDAGYFYQLLANHLNIHRVSEPLLNVETPNFVFGKTPAAGVLKQSVMLSNSGKGDLVISGLQLPDHWKAETKLPLTISPNQSVDIVLEVVSPKTQGHWNAEIKVRSNASNSPEIISFGGESVAQCLPSTNRIDLPTISDGALAEPETVKIDASSGLVLGEFHFSVEGFAAKWASRDSGKISINQTKPLPIGSYLGSLTIPLEWKGSQLAWRMPSVEIPFAANVRPSVIVTPMRVVVPATTLDAPQPYVIIVRPRDGKTAISPVVELPKELSAVGVTASVGEPDARQAVEITVHLPAGFHPSGHVGRMIRIQSNSPDNASFALPVEVPGPRPRSSFSSSNFSKTQPRVAASQSAQ